MIDWLNKNKVYASIILICYYLLVVIPHMWVSKLIIKIFGTLSRSNYNMIIAVLSVLVIVSGLFYLKNKLINNSNIKLWSFYIVSNLILVFLCFYFLFVVNIEVVHLPQYALFAILCFPLFNNTISTLTLSTFAGAMDELYQYLVLAPERSNYFDFNDIVIDLIGAAIGLLILRIIGISVEKFNISKWYKSFDFLLISLLVLFIFLGYQSGYLETFLTKESTSIFSFIKVPEVSFWTSPPGPPVKFHVLRPWEGYCLILLLWVFYIPLNTQKE